MKDEGASALNQLVYLFSWLIEAVIVYTGPGLIFFSLLFAFFPESSEWLDSSSVNPHMSSILAFLWPTTIGLLLSTVGGLLFHFFATRSKIADRVENELVQQQARISLSARALPDLMTYLTEEQLARFDELSAKQQDQLMQQAMQQVQNQSIAEVRRSLSRGMSLLPMMQFTASHEVKSDIRLSATGPRSVWEFIMGLMTVAAVLVPAVCAARVLNAEYVYAAAALVVGLGLFWLLYTAAATAYAIYLQVTLGMVYGIARMNEKKNFRAASAIPEKETASS